MSEPLAVIDGGRSAALDRVVATAKRMQEHDEVDHWQFADDVKEATDELSSTKTGFSAPGKANSGLYAALDTVQSEIKRAGAVDVASRETILGAYHTATAWPEELRVTGANYWAHHELRARAYDGKRQTVLARLVTRSSDGHVGTKEVRLWKSSRKPTKATPFLEQVEHGIRGFLLRKGKPWDRVAAEDRRAIGQMLRTIAYEIETSEFGR